MNNSISIIIPTFNSEKYIRNCLSSILNQTYKNYRVIVVDGGSDDNTISICKEYIKHDSRFSLIQTIKGVSHQRNIGKQNAKSDFIFFLDSDDEIEKKCLYSLLKYSRKYDIISPQIKFIRGNNAKKIEFLSNKENIAKDITYKTFYSSFYKCFLNRCNKLYKTDIIKNINFSEDLTYGEDTIFNLEIAKKRSFKYIIISESSYFYNEYLSNSSKYAKPECFFYINKLINFAKTEKNRDLKRQIYKMAAIEFIVLRNSSLKIIFNYKVFKTGLSLLIKNIINIKIVVKLLFPFSYHLFKIIKNFFLFQTNIK